MSHSTQHQEYSARYGLRSSKDNVEVAQQIAEAKFRSLTGRDIVFSEMVGINHLIEELHSLSSSPKVA